MKLPLSPPVGSIDPRTINNITPTVHGTVPNASASPPGAIPAPRVGLSAASASDAIVASSPTPATESSLPALADVLTTTAPIDPGLLVRKIGQLVVDQYRNVYVVMPGAGNPFLYRVGTTEFDGVLRKLLRQTGERITGRQLRDFVEEVRAEAEVSGLRATVWRRVAQLANGSIVIALHDDANTHVRISPGKVDILASESDTFFYRSPSSQAMAMPAATGDARLLRKYLNLDAVSFTLYLAWLTYTLAHAKVDSSKFVILVLVGGQGTGKSHAAKLTIRLVDPNSVGVERLPLNIKDLAIAAQNSHLLAYDNLRSLTPILSDTLCTMSTGGAITARKLYTDDDQKVLPLHAALLLNGIYPFVEQPDLAQRSMPLRLNPMAESVRKSDADLQRELEIDLPVIQRGLFDLISRILTELPTVQVTSPQRMIDFVRWLAGMEKADGVPAGVYQDAYADVLNEGQLDSLMDNVLGAAILDLVAMLGEEDPEWSGTPGDLLAKLNAMKFTDLRRPPREWPDNEIALSKRLAPLQAALMTQGVEVTFKRGKHRTITIRKIGGVK